MRIALITGASSGLGCELARLVDAEEKMDEIWLVARREDRLAALAQSFRTPSRALAMDLTGSDWLEELKDVLAREKPEISLLINNAGIGKTGDFTGLGEAHVQELLDLNVMALTQNTYACLPYMKEGGRIINIASVAAFLPQPNFSIYAASKSYVLSFSRALHRELKGRGISVTAVCPNPMMTEFFDKSGGIGPTGLKKMGLDKVGKVAQKALRRSRRGKDISITHPTAHAVRLMSKILPHSWILSLEKLVGFY